jgi:hypothetical protein
MIITAKFASTCSCCRQPIAVGSKIEWSKGSPAKHVACSQGPVSTGNAGHRRSYGRRASGAGYAAPVAGYSSWCTGRSGCGCYDCAS